MKVLHLSRAAVAGAPYFWSECMRKYGGPGIEDSRCFSQSTAYRDGRGFPADLDFRQARAYLSWADVIIVHNELPTCIGTVPQKRIVLAVHSRPNQIDDHLFRTRPVGVIAQHHPRFYAGAKDFRLIPNLIDLEAMRPTTREGRIKIGYSPSCLLDVPEGDIRWDSNKGYERTGHLLRVAGGDVFTNMRWDNLRPRLPGYDVWIDECVTGSYHRCSLQAAALGQVGINAAEPDVLANLQEVAGATSHPFLVCGIDHLAGRLADLVCDAPGVRAFGARAREWMERHWDPATLIRERFLPLMEKV